MNKAFLIITFVFIFINSYSQTNESAKREKAITEEFTELKINNNSTNPSIISLISEYGGQDNDLGRISSWIGDPEIAGLEVARIGMPAYISKSGHITFSTRQEPKFNGPTLTLKERMRISHNGSVGIGTTNPLTKLDVVGDIAIGKGNINSPLGTEYLKIRANSCFWQLGVENTDREGFYTGQLHLTFRHSELVSESKKVQL